MKTKEEIREAKRQGIRFEDARVNPEFIESAKKHGAAKAVNKKSKAYRSSKKSR